MQSERILNPITEDDLDMIETMRSALRRDPDDDALRLAAAATAFVDLVRSLAPGGEQLIERVNCNLRSACYELREASEFSGTMLSAFWDPDARPILWEAVDDVYRRHRRVRQGQRCDPAGTGARSLPEATGASSPM